jgi:hypothetical protein
VAHVIIELAVRLSVEEIEHRIFGMLVIRLVFQVVVAHHFSCSFLLVKLFLLFSLLLHEKPVLDSVLAGSLLLRCFYFILIGVFYHAQVMALNFQILPELLQPTDPVISEADVAFPFHRL